MFSLVLMFECVASLCKQNAVKKVEMAKEAVKTLAVRSSALGVIKLTALAPSKAKDRVRLRSNTKPSD